jgi:hypothetical protein
MSAPIALFVYRRPRHTARALEALAKAEGAMESDLYIFSDAAQDASAAADVRSVRQVTQAASGFRTVTSIERDMNWGLARSIADGVSTLVAKHGAVIVLEDDLEVAPMFLSYMNAALTHYERESAVKQIAGYMFPVADAERLPESFFLPLTTSWGWATWARAWGDGPASADVLLDQLASHGNIAAFSLNGAYDYLGMLQEAADGRVDSWAIRWYAQTWLAGGLTLYPRASMLVNTGMDGTGTHRGAARTFETPLWNNRSLPKMPNDLTVSSQALELVEAFLRSRQTPAWRRWLGAGWRRVFFGAPLHG